MKNNRSRQTSITVEPEGAIKKDDEEAKVIDRYRKMFDPFGSLPPPEKPPYTIFRMPVLVRKRNKGFCRPQVVSIGPYNRSKKHLRAMEVHKRQYLSDFLSRNIINNLGDYLKSMEVSEERARRCYFERPELNSKEFTEMLLLDGCFVIEFFIKMSTDGNITNHLYGGSLLVLQDLIMLENQIPFFVLENLFDLLTSTFPQKVPFSLAQLIDTLLVTNMLEGVGVQNETPSDISGIEFRHLLHLCYHCIVSRLEKSETSPPSLARRLLRWLNARRMIPFVLTCLHCFRQSKKEPSSTIPCATELQEAGVKFEKKKSANLFDITFNMGVLEMPSLRITDPATAYLLNLVAFEQCSHDKVGVFTTYAHFMDCLIDTPKDVAILEQCGIIENMLASPDDVALFFNSLSDGRTISEKHHLTSVFMKIAEYSELKWHKYRARLMRDYFSSPWTIISVVAAIYLLILTTIQTFYAAYPYYHHQS